MPAHRHMLPVLLAGTFMGFLDLFLVIVAVPSIATDLHASTSSAQLVLSMYVVAYGAALVIGGRLGDRFGRRRLFAVGMAGFTVFSAGCAVSPDVLVLIVMRVLQGVAGAAMLPQVLASIQALLDGERRRHAVLLYTTVLGAASAFGQLIGGGLLALDLFGEGWRVLFAINVPIGIVALALIGRTVPETTAPAPERVDVRGALALAGSLVLVLLGLGTGPSDGWPVWSWLLIGVGVAIALVLVPIERSHPTPLLPRELLGQRSVRWGLAATLAFFAANNCVFVGMTLFLQDGLHVSALGAGAAYLPLGAAYMASTLAGRWLGADRVPSGPRAIVIGASVMVAGLAVEIAAALLGAGPLALALIGIVFGVGLGFVYPAIVATVLARVRPGDEGAATGVLLTTTQMSNALGIAIVTAAFSALAAAPPRDRLSVGLGIAGVLVVLVIGAGARLREHTACGVPTPLTAQAGSAPAPRG